MSARLERSRQGPVLAQVAALPHDAHFMGIVLTALNALSTVHPEQNPALAGQNIYQSKEIQDKQIVRLIGASPLSTPACLHQLCSRTPGLHVHIESASRLGSRTVWHRRLVVRCTISIVCMGKRQSVGWQ